MSVFTWLADILGFEAPNMIDLLFISCAVFGALFFILMMALMLIGDIFGGVVDSAFDTDISMDSSLAFELFSLQGMAAAVMMFGLMGMFVNSATGIELLAVTAGGMAAAGSLYMVRYMMAGINNLQADGTMDPKHAIGQRGQVYSRIKPGETGEVQVTVDGSLRTLLARADDDKMFIKSGDFIKVIDIIGSTLIVEPFNRGTNTQEE